MADEPRHTSESDARLAATRREIALIDRTVLENVERRIHLAEEAAGLKTGLGLPIRNPGVEATVARRLEAACPGLGLRPGLGRELARFLIGCAIESQRHVTDEVISRTPGD